MYVFRTPEAFRRRAATFRRFPAVHIKLSRVREDNVKASHGLCIHVQYVCVESQDPTKRVGGERDVVESLWDSHATIIVCMYIRACLYIEPRKGYKGHAAAFAIQTL